MTTYYVRPDGNDANAGTGPGTGQAWATIAKALGASGIASGDTVYLMPGVYREANVSIGFTPAAETLVLGDEDGAIFGTPGEVVWTAYATNDTTAPAAGSHCVNLNGKPYLHFKRITFMGGRGTSGSVAQCIQSTTTGAHHTKLTSCLLVGGESGLPIELVRMTMADNVAFDLAVDGCIFVAPKNVRAFLLTGGKWNTIADIGVSIRNSVFYLAVNAEALRVDSSGTGTYFANGGEFVHNTVMGGLVAVINNNTNTWGNQISLRVVRNLILGADAAISWNNAVRAAVDAGNRIVMGGTAYPSSNVTQGPGSVVGHAHALRADFGHLLAAGAAPPRPFLTPLPASPLLAYSLADGQGRVPGTWASDNAIGTVAWTNPSNALIADDTRAVASAVAASAITQYLKGTMSGNVFDVPAGATIVGIELAIEKSAQNASSIRDNVLRLLIGGVISGNDKADTTNSWSTLDTVVTYGTPSDLWGLTPAPSDINATNFGFVLAAKNHHATTASDARVDWAKITVWYTLAGETYSTDTLVRLRPAGGGSFSPAAGALEPHDTWAHESSTVDTGDTYSARLDGPADGDIPVEILAATTKITCRVRYDTNHGAGTKPQVKLIGAGYIGVADQTLTMTAAADTWETVEFSVAPTGPGWGWIRLIARPAAASGKVFLGSVIPS